MPGMLECGDDLALAQEAFASARSEQGAPDDLERDLLLDLSVGALRPEHNAHAAAAEFLAQDVRADAIADGDAGRIDRCNRSLQHAIALLARVGMMAGVRREQGGERLRQIDIVAFDRPQQIGLSGGIHPDGLVEQGTQLPPLRGIDAIVHATPRCGWRGIIAIHGAIKGRYAIKRRLMGYVCVNLASMTTPVDGAMGRSM